jgi:uncharacterized protein YbjT (DUF2867 family)
VTAGSAGGDDPGRRRVAVAGANGFVGTNLVPHLAEHGWTVHALVRDAASIEARDRVEVHVADVADTTAVAEALAGCEVAYYLVHAMAGGEGFAERDQELARSFAVAAATAGVGRIVYLGGLGHDHLSIHLASRQEVGVLLGSSGVPVVELRAAVVLGAGSISFEMVRYLTERLPMMICPRWVNTPTQPIALNDLLDYLTESVAVEPGIYEVGCTDATTYRQMMDTYARVRGLRPRLVVKVPVLTPALSAHWVDLVTPVDATVSHALIESLANEVTVHTRDRTDAAFSVRPLSVEQAVRAALDDQADRIGATLFDRRHGLDDGVYTDRSRARVRARDVGPDGTVLGFAQDLDDCGGRLAWYGLPFAWLLRISLGNLFGEDLRLGRPARVEPGAVVDWWTVVQREPEVLVLRSRAWFCGEAWLGFRVSPALPTTIEQVGSIRTKGVLGMAYWWLLWPIHQFAFRAMVHHRRSRAHRAARSLRRR